MHEIDKMQKIENSKIQSHHPQINTRYDMGNPIREKTQLEGEVALLSFLWYRNDASTKKEALSVEFPLNCGLYGCYIISPPLLSHIIPLSDVFLSYGTRYNAKEWNPFSS
jgi:hypothetical protein